MKISIIILLGLAGVKLLGRRSAALRHWVLAVAIGCGAATPLLERLLPSWPISVGSPALVQRIQDNRRPTPFGGGLPSEPAQSIGRDVEGPVHQPLSEVMLGRLLGPIWIAGAVASLAVLLAGLARFGWLAALARRPVPERWTRLAREISGEYRVRRPVRLFLSDHPAFLATWGLVRPKIVLPAAAAGWSDDRLRVVFCHEIAHIKRGDWMVQLAAELLRAAYWFNPILWIACRRLRLESEHACDDAVLRRGAKGTEYAMHLVEIARTLKQQEAWCPAPAMARRSTLHRRVAAMLNSGLNRDPIRASRRIATTMLFVMLTMALAGAQALTTFSGSIVDPLGAFVPGVPVTLSSAERQATYQVQTDSSGRFEFVGLIPGDYAFEAQIPGFAFFRETLTLAGQPQERRITLLLGSLQETLTVSDADVPTASTVQVGTARINPPCPGSPAAGGPPVGGNIRAPRKIRDSRPEYPAARKGTGAEGIVVLGGIIGLDGFIKDIQVRGPADPEFARSLGAAVRQWQWDSTLLNCVPMELSITVTARFVHRP